MIKTPSLITKEGVFCYKRRREIDFRIVIFLPVTVANRKKWVNRCTNNEKARKIVLARFFAFPRFIIVTDFDEVVEEVRGFGGMEIRGYF